MSFFFISPRKIDSTNFFLHLFWLKVDRDNPEFPRSSGYWWFGCRSANKGTLGNVLWNGGYPIDNSFFYGNLEKPGANPPDKGFDVAHDDVGDIILDAGTDALSIKLENTNNFTFLFFQVERKVFESVDIKKKKKCNFYSRINFYEVLYCFTNFCPTWLVRRVHNSPEILTISINYHFLPFSIHNHESFASFFHDKSIRSLMQHFLSIQFLLICTTQKE